MSPKSCSSGLRSAPSEGVIGTRRWNGLLVKSRKATKPVLSNPITPSTRARKVSGRSRERSATASVQPAMIQTQSRNEPS